MARNQSNTFKTRVFASHYGVAIYIKKYLKAKKKFNGNSNVSPCKIIIFKRNPPKETKILQDIINL
jgi:hypothetical protein